jgi:hypothetical protein
VPAARPPQSSTNLTSIEPVVARMASIAQQLDTSDGVARFNELYLAVTREVATRAAALEFADPDFLVCLDVVFADLYFAAVDASVLGDDVPRAWEPLFEARDRPRIAPIQFALAGMNAHINHDLALALNSACDELSIELERGSPQHRDYLAVNEILERVQEAIKARFAVGLVGVADDALGRIDDVVATWSVARARDSAWTHAETLRALRRIPRLREKFEVTLARTVGLVGRALVIPTM